MSAPEHPAVSSFREYLRIPSVHPDVDYGPCVSFLRCLAEDAGLAVRVVEVSPARPVVVMTLTGSDPALPSILLNSHMDVVPVFREKWTHDPFGGEKDAQGNIFGRGAQDMKGVGIQQVEALRRLKDHGVALKRTVHVSFVPDEETSEHGMWEWVKTEDFKSMNVGCALDESFATPLPQYILFHAERTQWNFNIRCTGESGHGSLLLRNTAVEKLSRVMTPIFEFRDKERSRLRPPVPDLDLGSVTTLNLTMIRGGVQVNVVPDEFVATFDCRIAPDVDEEEFENFLKDVCKKAGEGVHLEFLKKESKSPVTRADSSNPFWRTIKEAIDDMGLSVKTIVCPGNTDGRFMRAAGVSVFGLTPINETPLRLHSHDEFVNERKFLQGIDILYNVVRKMADCG